MARYFSGARPSLRRDRPPGQAGQAASNRTQTKKGGPKAALRWYAPRPDQAAGFPRGLEKDLASARAGHVEAEVARTLGSEQTTTLAKSLQEKEVALQRAEQKVATVEVKFDEHKKAISATARR
jgi:hypothetical protein